MANNGTITATTTKILAKSTTYDVVPNAATADGANETQMFSISPVKGDEKIILRIAVANSHGSVAYSVAAGDFWMGVSALAGSVAQNKTVVLQLESAKYMKSSGAIEITFTPATGKILATNHALVVEVDELL
jgi:hypothetical protein